MRHENRSPHPLVSRRARDLGHVGAWPECPISTGGACTDCLDGGQRHTWAAHGARLGHLPAHDSALARAFSGSAVGGFANGRPSSRPYREYARQDSPRGGRGHAAHEAAGRNPLERAHHGEGAGHRSTGRSAYLDATQPQAPSRQDLQDQPRHTLCREALRCRRTVSQSPGQIPCAVGR